MSMPSNIQGWNSVNANFKDVNSAMGNSISGISQAGTIFGDLRKSILDEEQRAVDKAFREKQFNEQVSQFAATHEAAMAGVDAQNRSTLLGEKKYKDERDQLAIQMQVTQDVLGPFQDLKNEEANIITAINSGRLTDDDLAEKEARLAQIENLFRTELSARDLHQKIVMETVKRGGGVPSTTVMSDEAANERARTKAAIDRNTKTEENYEQSQVKANQIQAGLNLGSADTIALQKAMSKVQKQYPTLNPETAMSILASFYPTTGEIFSTKQKFDVPIDKPDYLADFDPTDKRNPIAIRIAQAANNGKNPSSGKGKGKNLLSGSGDTTEIPDSTSDSDDTDRNLGSLTDEALMYLREQELASLPSEPSPEQIQAEYNQLVKSRWADMPTNKIPPNEQKNLKEMSVQRAKSVIQKERAQATKPIDDEMRTRSHMSSYSWYGR